MAEEQKADSDLAVVEQPAQTVVARPTRADTSAMALVPQNIQEAAYTARLLASSGMFKHKTPEQAFAALMIGRELGLPPAAAMRAIDIIDGKPAPSADALVAACLRRTDLCEYFYCLEDEQTHSTWVTKRVGHPERRTSFTMKDAERAELTKKDVWKKYGARMMSHRAAAWLAREVYPDIVLGMYSEDEVLEVAEDQRPHRQQAEVAVVDSGYAEKLATRIALVAVDGGLDSAELPGLIAQASVLVKAGAPSASLAKAIKDARARVAAEEKEAG